MTGQRSSSRFTLIAVAVAIVLTGCQAHRPVTWNELVPALAVRAELSPPRSLPGVAAPVTQVRGIIRSLSADSVWIDLTEATTTTGAVVAQATPQSVTLPRDSTLRLSSSQRSPTRTWILVGGLIAAAALIVYGASGSAGTGGY